ncbi:SNF2 family N-terminal domain-containing protein [Mariannaea sp. PMI_226]|nr:SNF2 family N-terminal domain-containing protein [Mariannaea sp. PMI_226]
MRDDCSRKSPKSHNPSDSSPHRDSDHYCSDSGRKPKKSAKKKRPANARQFIRRLHKKEDARERKRKREEDGEAADLIPRKSQKTSSNSRPGKHHTKGNGNKSSKLEQYEKIRQSIPEGCDTRHSQTQPEELREATKLFGYNKVQKIDDRYLLTGMHTSLMPHQLVASAWMVKRELARAGPYGGLIADAMGFRKTVYCINTIVGNPPQKTDIKEFSKSTLIVVPNQSVARQWKNEIDKHVDFERRLSTYIYSRGAEMKPREIATYADLRSQHIKKKEIRELTEIHSSDKMYIDKEKWRRCGPLFHINWYRVILDEAHYIKSHTTSAALACWDLSSKFRWGLSGTPLANRLEEYYSYLKFLKCNFVTSYNEFKNTFCSDDTVEGSLDALISLMMLRRTSNDKFLGADILSLPDSECQDIWIPLSNEEKAISKALDAGFGHLCKDIQQANDTTEAEGTNVKDDQSETNNSQDTVEQNEKPVSLKKLRKTWYLRQRQAVSHPFNLEKCFRSELSQETIQNLRSELSQLDKISFRDQLKNGERYHDGISKYSKGFTHLEKLPGCVFGGAFDIHDLLTLAENDSLCGKAKCGICMKLSPPKPRFFFQVSECLDPKCSQPLEVGRYLYTLTGISQEANAFGYSYACYDSNGMNLSMKKGEQTALLASTMEETGVKLAPGSKLTVAMAVIRTWIDEAPDDKIIGEFLFNSSWPLLIIYLVFTDFVTTMKVLGRMLQLAEIPFLFYSGSMGAGSKSKALESFKQNPNAKVLLAALRAAGQALNLTVANRVIIVDPWFNTAQERQAFGRVLRIGQKKKSYLVRLLAEDGIDKEMVAMQDAKALNIDRGMQDDGHIPGMPTSEELKTLFSPIEEVFLKTRRRQKRLDKA